MKLGNLLLFARDLAEARRFYGDVLGMRLKADAPPCLVFAPEGCDLLIFECERDSLVEDYSRVARSAFVFEVPSIDATYRDLSDRGVVFLHEQPAENELGRYAAFRDPFGNVHEIFEPRDR